MGPIKIQGLSWQHSKTQWSVQESTSVSVLTAAKLVSDSQFCDVHVVSRANACVADPFLGLEWADVPRRLAKCQALQTLAFALLPGFSDSHSEQREGRGLLYATNRVFAGIVERCLREGFSLVREAQGRGKLPHHFPMDMQGDLGCRVAYGRIFRGPHNDVGR
jgi:hypothetical protein